MNDAEIPVWIADEVLMGNGAGAIVAVWAHDDRERGIQDRSVVFVG